MTGISAGALIAPFAFLGSAYDPVLERIYTQHAAEDLIQSRHPLRAIRSDAGFDTASLRALLAAYFVESVMRAIAETAQEFRLLIQSVPSRAFGCAQTKFRIVGSTRLRQHSFRKSLLFAQLMRLRNQEMLLMYNYCI